MHGSHVALGLLLISCGARSDLDVSAPPLADSAPPDGPKIVSGAVDAAPDVVRPVDATLDAVRRGDAAHFADAGIDATHPVDAGLDAAHPVDAGVDTSGICSTPVVTIGDCNIPSCCKFGVTWTCGSQTFSVGGGCQTTAGGNGYQGECSVNGTPSSMFSAASTSCLCQDAGALGAFVETLCDVSPPPSPP